MPRRQVAPRRLDARINPNRTMTAMVRFLLAVIGQGQCHPPPGKSNLRGREALLEAARLDTEATVKGTLVPALSLRATTGGLGGGKTAAPATSTTRPKSLSASAGASARAGLRYRPHNQRPGSAGTGGDFVRQDTAPRHPRGAGSHGQGALHRYPPRHHPQVARGHRKKPINFAAGVAPPASVVCSKSCAPKKTSALPA